MRKWKERAARLPNSTLREQALKSLSLKQFHALGGSVYAIWYSEWEEILVPAIVAIQTISDYLDNLCDRMQLTDPDAFRRLHRAFLDALDPAELTKDYYNNYPCKVDGGYLKDLVVYAQQYIKKLPSFFIVKEEIKKLATLYCDLQVYKHMDPLCREKVLSDWAKYNILDSNDINSSDIKWWEYSAAAGSTLGIFALLAAATRPQLTVKDSCQIIDAYFPWICGLHILLDYFIDQHEDRLGGDLNFVAYYSDEEVMVQRLKYFLQKAMESAQSLPDARFHTLVVKGLPALYLSDAKVREQNLMIIARHLLYKAGHDTQSLFQICRTMRYLKLV